MARREGEQMADDLQPWEQPGAVRRDCEPHREHLLGVLGAGSLACGVLSLFLLPLAPIGLALGIVTELLADRDLLKMSRGRMDPRGRDGVRRAASRGLWGIACSLVGLFCGPVVLILLLLRP